MTRTSSSTTEAVVDAVAVSEEEVVVTSMIEEVAVKSISMDIISMGILLPTICHRSL